MRSTDRLRDTPLAAEELKLAVTSTSESAADKVHNFNKNIELK